MWPSGFLSLDSPDLKHDGNFSIPITWNLVLHNASHCNGSIWDLWFIPSRDRIYRFCPLKGTSTYKYYVLVAALTYTEDSLLTTTDSDFKIKKKLYEKLGDGACELKDYDKAIDYYKKMLEYAELSGECGKQLIPCYVSLAQTYKDNKDYNLALDYFQKEYQLCCDNPKESQNTLLNIAEVMELLNKNFDEIKKIYENAKTDAHATKEIKIEGKVTEKYISFLKKYKKFTEASDLEKELRLMDYTQSDSEDSNSDSCTPNIGEDIAISDITDVSDPSENEDIDNVKRTRKRGRGINFKKNSKGKTTFFTSEYSFFSIIFNILYINLFNVCQAFLATYFYVGQPTYILNKDNLL